MTTPPQLLARIAPLIAVLTLTTGATAPNLPNAAKFIADAERDWALAVASGDTTIVEQIVADDFIGVAPDGTQYNRQEAIRDTRESAKDFVSNHLNRIKVRFFGNTAVAQGDETWEKQAGEQRHGRYVWTDTWVLRNGHWQIVAAEDLAVLDPGQ
jgi:hypothetical protein